MTLTNPLGRLHSQRSDSQRKAGPVFALAATLTAALVIAAAMQPLLPHQALAPLIAGTLFALAAVVAALAWLRPSPRKHFDYWDAAGLLTFIAICAATAVEPGQMVELTAGGQRQP